MTVTKPTCDSRGCSAGSRGRCGGGGLYSHRVGGCKRTFRCLPKRIRGRLRRGGRVGVVRGSGLCRRLLGSCARIPRERIKGGCGGVCHGSLRHRRRMLLRLWVLLWVVRHLCIRGRRRHPLRRSNRWRRVRGLCDPRLLLLLHPWLRCIVWIGLQARSWRARRWRMLSWIRRIRSSGGWCDCGRVVLCRCLCRIVWVAVHLGGMGYGLRMRMRRNVGMGPSARMRRHSGARVGHGSSHRRSCSRGCGCCGGCCRHSSAAFE